MHICIYEDIYNIYIHVMCIYIIHTYMQESMCIMSVCICRHVCVYIYMTCMCIHIYHTYMYVYQTWICTVIMWVGCQGGSHVRQGDEKPDPYNPPVDCSLLTLLKMSDPSLSPSPSRVPQSPENLLQRIWKKCGHEFTQDLFVVDLYPHRNQSLE